MRNERVKEYTPPFIVPPSGKYIWDIYGMLNRAVPRVIDGFYRSIPPSEYLAWQQITGSFVLPWEYDILAEMDMVFCEETNKEIEAVRFREEEKRNRELEQKSKKGRR